MKIFVTVYAICLVIVSDAQKSFSPLPCTSLRRIGRIVGGSDAKEGELPFIVSLTRRGGHYCGAAILNEKWLVTAAHCVCSGLDTIFKASYIKGVAGMHQISKFKNSATNSPNIPFEITFQQIVVHPKYDCTKPNDDIALLEMAKKIEFNQNVQPVCIAENVNGNFEDSLATVSGWGWTKEDQENGIKADILQKALVKVWKSDECQSSFEENGKKTTILSTQMCAGYKNGGIDSCWADSGGPLVTNDNILIGVVSTGIGCARPGLPGIYTRVSSYSEWIESVIDLKV